MILTNIKRVLKAGLINFWRNGWVSLATILIIIITLFTIGSLIFGKSLLDSTLMQLQDKVDISVYFKVDAEEERIMALKDAASKLNEVKDIEYISREQALINFQERHINNALIVQSLEELEDNPLGAVLNIKANDPSHYEGIANFLDSESDANDSSSFIDKINYFQNKVVIERLTKIMDSARNMGFSISIILIVISILVTFNTVRLAIYTSKEEISIMRLMGAGNKFISGPFIITGVIYGIIAGIIAMVIFYPITYWLGPITGGFFGGFNIFEYYINNFIQLGLILVVSGIVLCSVSSLIAIRRYLKV